MEGKPRILVVDDNDNMCKTLSLILDRKGYPVATAQSGLEAIEKIKEQPFDVTLVDVKVPVMNGVEACRRIKEIRPGVAAIVMTAYTVEDVVREVLEEGAYGIVYKPLDIEKVLALIEEAVEVKQGALALVVDDDLGLASSSKTP